MNRKKLKTLFTPLAFIGYLFTAAASHAQQHEAHVHGIATLTIAVESKMLELEIESPANNLVGFEHKATTKAQRNAVISAKAALSNPTKLFSFAGATCNVKHTKIDVSAVMEEHDDHDGHKHHDEHKHHDDHRSETHSEIKANYEFNCTDTKKLDAVVVQLFKAFPGIEEINTMWITANKQGSEKLTKQRNTVSFK